MGLSYKNLDDITRDYMVDELLYDQKVGKVYISSRLTQTGKGEWFNLLKEALQKHDDNWLAQELKNRNYIKKYERTKKGLKEVPNNASETLAEGEFNRYYIRGVCRRAIDENIGEVEVYRGKPVKNPRPESQVKVGQRIKAAVLLEDLRTSVGKKPALGIPQPNSGLTVKLP